MKKLAYLIFLVFIAIITSFSAYKLSYLLKDKAESFEKINKYNNIYDENNIKPWINNSFIYTPKDKPHDDIQNLLRNEIGIGDDDSELQKSIKIGSFVLTNLDDLRGSPKITYHKDPYTLWSLIMNGETKIWCKHFASAYSMFANNAGIPTRLVSIRSTYNNQPRMHTLAESYIRELGKWIMVDLTHNQMYVKNSQGLILSTYQAATLYSSQNPGENYSLSPLNLTMHNTQRTYEIDANSPDYLSARLFTQHQYLNKTTTLKFTRYHPTYELVELKI